MTTVRRRAVENREDSELGGEDAAPRRANSNRKPEDDDSDEEKEKEYGQNQLTLMEEVLLLGLKDQLGYLSLWNDNISYVLRGCILMELSLRNRIGVVAEQRKRPAAERILEVTNSASTGEVLLDETLKLIKVDQQSISAWIDLLSGETWNPMKIGYQLKQVRERLAKGLVDKGVLRTEKQNFLLFDMATHPVADMSVKETVVRRVIDCLLGRGPAPDRRTIALVCAAYAANVLENALINLSHSQREAAFTKVDEILQENANYSGKTRKTSTEVISGVLSVFTKMDNIL